MEHRHAIIVICDCEGNYLQYYDNNWDSYLFLNCKVDNEDDLDKVALEVRDKINIDALDVKYVFSKVHTKYSIKDKIDKLYHHYFYKVTVDLSVYLDKEFSINNIKYKWFSYDELINDKRAMEVNSDIIGFIKYMDINIRLADFSDSYNLSVLKQRVWRETYTGIYSDSRINNYDYDEKKKKFDNIISNKDVSLYVLEDKGELIGYMSVGVPVRKYLDYEQEIGLLYLRRDYQGLGFGKRLFKLAYNIIKNNGYNKFFISCNKYNTYAREFYLRMGGKLVCEDSDSEEKHLSQVKFHFDII